MPVVVSSGSESNPGKAAAATVPSLLISLPDADRLFQALDYAEIQISVDIVATGRTIETHETAEEARSRAAAEAALQRSKAKKARKQAVRRAEKRRIAQASPRPGERRGERGVRKEGTGMRCGRGVQVGATGFAGGGHMFMHGRGGNPTAEGFRQGRSCRGSGDTLSKLCRSIN